MAATSGTKWMSATIAVSKPSSRTLRTMFARFSPSRRPCAVRRTIPPPARSIRSIWAAQASVSLVSVLVIDCTATGCPPPITTRPMRTSPLGRRLYSERFIIVHACNAADRTVPSQRRIAPNTAGTRPVRAKISLTKTVQVERRAEKRLCRDAACLSRSLSSAKITHNFANCE